MHWGSRYELQAQFDVSSTVVKASLVHVRRGHRSGSCPALELCIRLHPAFVSRNRHSAVHPSTALKGKPATDWTKSSCVTSIKLYLLLAFLVKHSPTYIYVFLRLPTSSHHDSHTTTSRPTISRTQRLLPRLLPRRPHNRASFSTDHDCDLFAFLQPLPI